MRFVAEGLLAYFESCYVGSWMLSTLNYLPLFFVVSMNICPCFDDADKAERLIAEAAAYGAQIVVFPEAFVGGYPRGSNFGVTIGSRSAKGKDDFRKYYATAIDVPGKNNTYNLIVNIF